MLSLQHQTAPLTKVTSESMKLITNNIMHYTINIFVLCYHYCVPCTIYFELGDGCGFGLEVL